MKPKYLVDTVYLIAYLNPSDKLHSQAVNTLHQEKHSITYSSHALQELDLILKSRGYTPTERANTWLILEALIEENIAPPHPADYQQAAQLEQQGYDYFDALIAAQAARLHLTPLTTDKQLKQAHQQLQQTAKSRTPSKNPQPPTTTPKTLSP